jgi:hypothetical protein
MDPNFPENNHFTASDPKKQEKQRKTEEVGEEMLPRKKANDSGIGHRIDASSAFPVHWSLPARCLGW